MTTHGISTRHIQLRVRMFQDSFVAEHNGHSCMWACILYGMHVDTLCSVHDPTGLRTICGKFCKIFLNGMQKFGVIGFEVVRIGSHQRRGCASCTLCHERADAQYEVDRMARKGGFCCLIARISRSSTKTERI